MCQLKFSAQAGVKPLLRWTNAYSAPMRYQRPPGCRRALHNANACFTHCACAIMMMLNHGPRGILQTFQSKHSSVGMFNTTASMVVLHGEGRISPATPRNKK